MKIGKILTGENDKKVTDIEALTIAEGYHLRLRGSGFTDWLMSYK
ncbi:hypothetical protein GCM10007895_20610 [Paraferrimonas sedimenticola]|uniref:Uncharacterized protein n=1 Tax=Paraferrimonas sedimenticola TaxID=375674 RepID=A0AA37RVW4_9GAMM|nr:hypothetical protein GCM10007895_20610 [Paraferrimonas sedimenticola]